MEDEICRHTGLRIANTGLIFSHTLLISLSVLSILISSIGSILCEVLLMVAQPIALCSDPASSQVKCAVTSMVRVHHNETRIDCQGRRVRSRGVEKLPEACATIDMTSGISHTDQVGEALQLRLTLGTNSRLTSILSGIKVAKYIS